MATRHFSPETVANFPDAAHAAQRAFRLQSSRARQDPPLGNHLTRAEGSRNSIGATQSLSARCRLALTALLAIASDLSSLAPVWSKIYTDPSRGGVVIETQHATEPDSSIHGAKRWN